MALTVAAISLAIGCLTVAKLFLPAVDAWTEGRELVLGTAVVLGVLVAFGVGMAAARRGALASAGN